MATGGFAASLIYLPQPQQSDLAQALRSVKSRTPERGVLTAGVPAAAWLEFNHLGRERHDITANT